MNNGSNPLFSFILIRRFSNTFYFPEPSPPPSPGSLICDCQKACTLQVCTWWDNSLSCQHTKGLFSCVFTQIACPSSYNKALLYHTSSCIFHVPDAQMFFVIVLSSTTMHLSAAEIREVTFLIYPFADTIAREHDLTWLSIIILMRSDW